MQVIPYFYFKGNAKEALTFYQNAFSTAEPNIMKYKEQPGSDFSEEVGEMVMHAEFLVGDNPFYVSDSLEEISSGTQVQVNINCETEEQIESFFKGLSEGANITMPLEKQFWGAIFGSLTDQYGISWSFNYQLS